MRVPSCVSSRLRVSVCLFCILAAAGLLYAGVYYVDQGHLSASDSNPGTEALPWLTIQHAADTAIAGDTVWVKAGTYNEHVAVQNSGSAGSLIRFAAHPGDTVVIDGIGIALPEYAGLFEVDEKAYIEISGFRVVNTGPNGTNTGIQVAYSSHVTVSNNSTYNTASSGIIVWGSDHVLVDGNDIELACSLGAASQNECISVGESDTFEISNNHVHNGSSVRGEGIDAKDGSSNGSVHGNHVHHVQSVGIYVDAWDKHTYNIDVYANRVHDIDGSAFAVGSESGGLLENVRVFNNLGYDTWWAGIMVHNCCDDLAPNHPLSNIQIINNTFVGNGTSGWGGGILHENMSTTGLVIRNNICSNNHSFEIALEGPDPGTVTADHNLISTYHGYTGEIYGADYQLGDPLFVDTTSKDFHLQVGSPAIDNGSAVAAPTTDHDNNPRPHGAGYDIGAYEYGATATAIFADGFESGTTGAWSAAVG